MAAWKKTGNESWLLALAIVVTSTLATLTIDACSNYQRPACAVIDVASDVCKYVTIKFPDGHSEEVPKAEAVGAMRRAGLVRP